MYTSVRSTCSSDNAVPTTWPDFTGLPMAITDEEESLPRRGEEKNRIGEGGVCLGYLYLGTCATRLQM
jgi:hypothetical protein